VENPADLDRSVLRLQAKAAAGAEFVQTQITFAPEVLSRWMELVRAAGLPERLRILVGVAPVRRPAVARYLQDHVAGVSLPHDVICRLETASDPEAEGVAIAAEVIRGIRTVEGVAGVHLMTFGWAAAVRRVVEAL
jgi:methylenetetrahydrofolate reductase (NADPH)